MPTLDLFFHCVWPGFYKPQWCVQALASHYSAGPPACPSQAPVGGKTWRGDSTAPCKEEFQPAGPEHSPQAGYAYTQAYTTLSGLFVTHESHVHLFSYCKFTYESRSVLYSKTPEIKWAANLGKKNFKIVKQTHTHTCCTWSLLLILSVLCCVTLNTIMLYVNQLVKEPFSDQYHINQTTAFTVC